MSLAEEIDYKVLIARLSGMLEGLESTTPYQPAEGSPHYWMAKQKESTAKQLRNIIGPAMQELGFDSKTQLTRN